MIDTIVWLLTFVITGYAVLVLTLFVVQRHLLYHPKGILPPPAAVGLDTAQVVTVPTADGLRLTGWYVPPASADRLVLLHFHGNSGSIADRAFKARPFLAAGFGLLLLEYRGFAGSPGSPSEQGLYADARGGLAWLEAQGIPPRRVAIWGESLGSGVAVHLASETAPAAVLLEAAYTSIVDVAAQQYPFVPVRWLALDRFDSLAKIAAIDAPILIVHGEQDRLIPPMHARSLLAAARMPKQAVFLPTAGHADLFSWGAGESMVRFLLSLPPPSDLP